jgi:hypothetical protein
MRFKVALDIDDVLAQFYPAMCKRFGVNVVQTNIWDPQGPAGVVAQNFHIIQYNKMFWLNLEKESLPEDINFDVACYITASPPLMKTAREQWLAQHNFPPAPVVMTANKAQEMRVRGIDVLVDDKPATIKSIRASNLIGIQYVPSYMNDILEEGPVIRHLSQVMEVLKNY